MLRDETVPVIISKADITCPIEGEIFFQPVMTYPCLHIFEKHGIDKWRAQHNTCPDCRTRIRAITQVPKTFENMLNSALKQNPDLQNERFFHLSYLVNALKDTDSTSLEKIVEFFNLSDNRLNEIHREEDELQYSSPVYWMLCSTFRNNDLLSNNFRKKISAEALNTRLADGDSALAWMTAGINSTTWLIEDPILRSKISAETLNQPDTHNDKARNPLYYLTLSSDGVDLICRDHILRDKIDTTGLNMPFKKEDNKFYSALSNIARRVNGRKLLRHDSTLRSKVRPEGLRTVHADVSWLILDKDSRKMLAQDAELRAKITTDGLNELDEEDHSTLVYQLLLHHIGQEMLRDDSVLRSKINAQGLNAVRSGHNAGDSAVYELCKRHIGRKILKHDARLRNLITAETLNMAVAKDENKSAAYWLLNTPDGKELLEKDQELRGKIRTQVVIDNTGKNEALHSNTLFSQSDAAARLPVSPIVISTHRKRSL